MICSAIFWLFVIVGNPTFPWSIHVYTHSVDLEKLTVYRVPPKDYFETGPRARYVDELQLLVAYPCFELIKKDKLVTGT